MTHSRSQEQACRDDEALRKGVNMVDGKITYEAVAKVFGLPYTPIDEVMGILK